MIEYTCVSPVFSSILTSTFSNASKFLLYAVTNAVLIDSNNYDEETIKSISDFYSRADDYTKEKLFNVVSKGSDISQVMKQNEETSNKNWTL